MALNELKSLTRSMVAGQQHVRGCILEGLQEAIVQFNRLLQNSKQVCVMLLINRDRLPWHSLDHCSETSK